MLSRKYYKAFAAIIKAAPADTSAGYARTERDSITHRLCVLFAKENPRFDSDKFREACGVPR